MSKTNDGGPAFQRTYYDVDSEMVERVRDQDPGMTLRDWFAGMAMEALVTVGELETSPEVAITAYDIADAMLAEREKGRA